MTKHLPQLSVIVATKGRAQELRTVSLPSLARQDNRCFEVIVWDASEDLSSRRVVEEFAAAHRDLTVRYFKAPRAGSAAQRNDAVREARGEIVFFIDDDSEVSPDGIAALEEMFSRQETLAGGCLPLSYALPQKEGQSKRRTGRVARWLLCAYNKTFRPSSLLSGAFPALESTGAGLTDRLVGFDMAFRKEILRDHHFDERLQRYSGYALFEDGLFSHQLHREGLLLSVAERGLVIHRAAPAERVRNPFNKGRLEGYNPGIVWRTIVFPFAPWSAIPFVWARIGFLGVVLLPCLTQPWQTVRWKRLAGYLAGLWVFMLEEIIAFAPGGSK